MRPIYLNLTPAAQSATVVAASQTVSGASNLTLAAGAAAIDSGVGGRILGIVSGGNDSSITFTITGLDPNGQTISEVVTGANVGTAVSTKFYSSISSIKTSGSTASTVTVGSVNTTLSASSNLIPVNTYSRIAAQVAVEVTGTINYTIQETFDNYNGENPTPASNCVYFTPSNWSAGKTANAIGTLDITARGLKVLINSYSTGASLKVCILQPSNTK